MDGLADKMAEYFSKEDDCRVELCRKMFLALPANNIVTLQGTTY